MHVDGRSLLSGCKVYSKCVVVHVVGLGGRGIGGTGRLGVWSVCKFSYTRA